MQIPDIVITSIIHLCLREVMGVGQLGGDVKLEVGGVVYGALPKPDNKNRGYKRVQMGLHWAYNGVKMGLHWAYNGVNTS